MSVSQAKANKKPWYKVWWVWVIILIVLAGIGGAGKDKPNQAEEKPTQTASSQLPQSAAEKPDMLTKGRVNLSALSPQKNQLLKNVLKQSSRRMMRAGL